MSWPIGVPRPEQTRERISASKTGKRYEGRVYAKRPCRTCGKEFQGNSARHWFCSKECKAVAHYEMKSVVTDAEYRVLLACQDGKCAICETTDPGGPKTHGRFYADHDHATGEPRGLLCFRCNTALGKFDDSAKLLLRAAAYVSRSPVAMLRVQAGPRQLGTANAICRQCGIPFHVMPSAVAKGGGIYCSKNCYHLGRWGRPHPRKGIPNPERWPPRETACIGCGVTFEFRGKRDRKYCNRSCAADHRRAGAAGRFKAKGIPAEETP